MAESIQYHISVPQTYEDKEGHEKTAWTTVGRAFANDSGNISLDIPDNISVSGRVVLFPRDDSSEPDEE